MKQMKVLFVLLVMLVMASVQVAHADIVRGKVVDADTKEPLPDASLTCTKKYGNNSYGITTTTTDSVGMFTFYSDARTTMEVSMLGYYTKSKTVMPLSDSNKDTLDIGMIELKMSPQMLQMVEVKGHARRFTVRGDTIVFNPDAFHLQEGARLDELIRKLPGVQVDNDGKLTWNGKPIRLTMDGESLFGGDDLVNKLPAEAVQDIKAYNKASDFAERTGKQDGEEDMVLDLTIKPGFLDRWYGDIKAGYQSPKYYEGVLSMNRLSKSDPVMIFADANNMERRHRKYMGGMGSSWGNGFGSELGGAAGYQHNWIRSQGKEELKSNYSFSGGLAHNDNWSSSRTEIENYFPDAAVNRQNVDTYRRNHELNPRFRADMRWRIDTLNSVTLRVETEHKDKRSQMRQTTEQEEYIGEGYVPTLSQLESVNDKGRETLLRFTAMSGHQITKEGQLGTNFILSYTDGKTDSWTERDITDRQGGSLSSKLSQYAHAPLSRLTVEAGINYRFWATKRWQLFTAYRPVFNRNSSSQNFVTNGEADAANSFSNRYSRFYQNAEISSTIDLSTVKLMPKFVGFWQRETQDYERGLLDTAAVRRSFVVNPSFKGTWKPRKNMNVELNYAFSTQQPELLKTIGYRDMTNPLYITEGNPNLENSHVNAFSLKYNMILSRQQISLGASVSYRTVDHTTINALSYDPATSVYTVRPENVKGGESWSFQLNYDHGMGELFRLEDELSLNLSNNYGYLTLLPTQTERTLNRQSNFHPTNKFTFSYDKDWLKASVFANVDANRLRFSASPEQNTTLWDNEFGMNFEATIGNFVFGSRLSENMRRGYAAQSMNRNYLLWDGAITWKILKNKANLKLEFEDILNKEDGFYSQQEAYQQISSWFDFRHHYVGLAFTYRLDAKKKD